MLFRSEGDYTNYDFSDYAPTKAGKYKVDYKVTGKNLVDRGNVIRGYYYKHDYKPSDYSICCDGYIKVRPNASYTITVSNYSYLVYTEVFDKNFNCIAEYNTKTITIPNQGAYIRFCTHSSADHAVDIDNITVQIEEGNTATAYEPYKEYTKTLYLNSPLLEGDTIEEKDGGIYHVHRYKEIVLDGSDDENWLTYTSNLTSRINTMAFRINLDNFLYDWVSMDESICDKFCALSDIDFYSGDIEGINSDSINGGQFLLAINKSRLSAQDVAGLKQWLQQNPVTIVYELASPDRKSTRLNSSH